MKVKHIIESSKNNLLVAYHVAPSKYDQVIEQHGLRAREPAGIYVWGDLRYAQWFAELHRGDGKKMTIWQVNVSDLHKRVDDETYDMSEWSTEFEQDEFGEGYIVQQSQIEPERLRMLHF